VPENQCFLTAEGRSVLESLIQKVYPRMKKLNKSKLREHTGLARDTVIKIFNQPYQPVQKRCFEDLFRKLNEKLQEDYKNRNPARNGESQTAYELRIAQALKEIRIVFNEDYLTDEDVDGQSPSFISPQRSRSNQSATSQSSQTSQISPLRGSCHEELATLLGSLNYTMGQATFEESMKRLKPVGAFLLQVSDTKIQRWLVKRLAQEVSGFETGKRLEINMACLGNFESLWSELARGLKLPSGTAETTIASLSELCQEKTVIITLFRFQQLDLEMQQRLMAEFWCPLVRRIRSQQLDRRSRLVLFLIQDGARSKEGSQYPFQVVAADAAVHAEHPVMLEPLKQITSHEVEDWFDRKAWKLLAQIRGEGAKRFIQPDQISTWEPHPWETLENICNVFQTEITDIEFYWKLAG
jgi:inactive STAND